MHSRMLVEERCSRRVLRVHAEDGARAAALPELGEAVAEKREANPSPPPPPPHAEHVDPALTLLDCALRHPGDLVGLEREEPERGIEGRALDVPGPPLVVAVRKMTPVILKCLLHRVEHGALVASSKRLDANAGGPLGR